MVYRLLRLQAGGIPGFSYRGLWICAACRPWLFVSDRLSYAAQIFYAAKRVDVHWPARTSVAALFLFLERHFASLPEFRDGNKQQETYCQ